jgi:hypothetical protein
MIGRNEAKDVDSFWRRNASGQQAVELVEEAASILEESAQSTHKAEFELGLFEQAIQVQTAGAYADILP